MDARTLLGLARSRPTRRRWTALVDGVDELSSVDPDAYEAVVDDLNGALDRWDPRLRQAPSHWWTLVREGSLPWGWELVRSLVAEPGDALDQGDVMSALTHLDLRALPLTPGADCLGPDDLQAFTALRAIDVSGLGLHSLDALRGCRELVELVAYECHRLVDLSALGDDLCLEVLQLAPLRPAHVAAIGATTSLAALEVDHGTGLVSLDSWRGLDQLEALGLRRLDGLESLSGVQGMTALERLHVDRAPDLRDITALAAHPSLREAELSHCPAVDDRTVLATFQGR